MTRLVDVNVWVALELPGHPHHGAVSHWWTRNRDRLFFCRVTQQGFLRLMSNEKLTTSFDGSSYSNAQAIDLYHKHLHHEQVDYHDEPEGLEATWLRLASSSLASHRIWTDAYLAAFAITGNLLLVTLDKGFTQFQPHGLNLQLLP